MTNKELADVIQAECYTLGTIEREYYDAHDVCAACGGKVHVTATVGGLCSICARDSLQDEWNGMW